MEQNMKAVVLSDGKLIVKEVTKPVKAEPGHLLIRMVACVINPGDKFFLTRPPMPGTPSSLYDIRGVSGVGRVTQIGSGVPAAYLDSYVTIYRQLSFSTSVVGTWSEYAHVPFLDCAILPQGVDPEPYAGSLVNIITPYGFMEQITAEGHAGIISTAGNSATGRALLGICLARNFPLISLVREEEAKQQLIALGAKNVLVQTDPLFPGQLSQHAAELRTTAIFDGIGGAILNPIIPHLPMNSTIYSYGYLGDSTPLTVHMTVLAMKNIRIQPFANTSTATVKQPDRLEKALAAISALLPQPHFTTRLGQRFPLEGVNDAIAYQPGDGRKSVLVIGAQ